MNPRLQTIFAVGIAIVALATSGCVTTSLAPHIVQAPNQHGAPTFRDDPENTQLLHDTFAASFRVSVGPPDAELAIGVINPGDYRHTYQLEVRPNPGRESSFHVRTRWRPQLTDAPAISPKGTIIILHGFWMRRETMVHWALHLAEAGFRTVLVDLRGHGEATGDWITFGAVESKDLSQVLDELERRELTAGPVGVLGASYGAVVGLNWAARDPRVRSIVALEPFSDAWRAIGEYARAQLGNQAKIIGRDYLIRATARQAGKLAGFDWRDADPRAATKALKIPVLFLHGAEDTTIPPYHSETLGALAPAGSRVNIVPGADHIQLPLDLDLIGNEVRAWFQDHLAVN